MRHEQDLAHDGHPRTALATPLRSTRGLLVAVGIAGALTMSGCGLLSGTGGGTDEPCGSAMAGCVQVSPTDEVDAGTDAATDPTDGAVDPGAGETTDGSDGSETSGETSAADEEDWIKTESLAGDESIDLDENGDGKFPVAALEADIKDLFTNKYDIPVDTVECAHDATMIDGSGSTICDIETPDRTYYGSIVIEQDEGDLFRYELQFPGLDKDALNLD